MASDLASRLDQLERELARLEIELAQVRALAAAAQQEPDLEPELEVVYETVAAPTVEPASDAPPPPTREWTPQKPAGPPKPPRRTFGQLAEDWELVGPRGFAIVGGAVLALGIGFFFVLAANRGWIGESARIALGAAASALALGAGIWLRVRFGQYWAALGAVGAGIAGAYATLAAATARYDLVPDGLGLPIAGGIAAVGTVIALRWHSQVIAGIGLLGAALAPALQALDAGLTWESVAFALIVLTATSAVAVNRGWHELLHAVAAVVGAQALWLVEEAGTPADTGTVAMVALLVATLLATAVGLQVADRRTEVVPLALAYALLAFGLPLVTVASLFADERDRGLALVAAAAIWLPALALVGWRRRSDLVLVLVLSALALTAVGTALLLTDSALTLAWAAQAVVLGVLARRFADARFHVTSIAYAVLATANTLGDEGVPGAFFDSVADHWAATLPLAASALGLATAGLAAPATYEARTETGLLAIVGHLRKGLERHRLGVQETLLVIAAAVATLAASFALVALSWEWGHVAATALAAAVGGLVLGLAGRTHSDGLATAAYAWLGAAFCVAVGFDAVELYASETDSSIGGWAVAAVGVAILGGAYAHRLSWPSDVARDALFGTAATLAAAGLVLGAALVVSSRTATGAALLVVAVGYAALSATVFGAEGRRQVATVLWSLALTLLVSAELLVVGDGTWRAVPVAATALAVAALARPLREERLWLAGGALAVTTTAAVLLLRDVPWLEEAHVERGRAIATAVCAASALGVAALRWGEARWRDAVSVIAATGLVAVLATERILLSDPRATAIGFALTGGAVALLARPLGEFRVWAAGVVVVGVTLFGTLVELTPPSHLLVASASPADGLWVLLACLAGLAVVALSCPDAETRIVLEALAAGIALYALSLGILEVAERVSSASVETDFERGHTAVSGLWALVGLALLVVGLLRGSAAIRHGGLALFALSLAKIFLYDLSSLSSVARAFSFILVGGLLLAGGFFLQRLTDRLGPPRHQ